MSTTQNPRLQIGLLLVRAMLGVVFIYHGAEKLFGAFGGPGIEGFATWLESLGIPLPKLNAIAAAVTEFVGGIALLAGFRVRLAAIPLAFTMVVAAATAHSGFHFAQGGNEFPITLAVVLAGLALTGGGELTLASLFAARRSERVAASPAA